ncbi:MAG: SCO6745 family protein, partial [Streptosporangiaceae bacterium]
MADAAQTARSMWTLFEPIHAVIYFTPEGRSAFEQAGLRGFWRGYFAGRAAPLGRVSAAVVTASFFGFAPGMVARAIPGIWELISPADALRTRLAGATDALGRLLPEADVAPQVAKAAGLLWEVTGELDCAGRVLAAANAALPAPDGGVSGLARLWQAVTLLREHRGDGHFAALVAAGVDGCESIVLRC